MKSSEYDHAQNGLGHYTLSFAMGMQRVLQRNIDKGKSGWEGMTPKQVLKRVRDEVAEIARKVEAGEPAGDEWIDVANFCLFGWTNEKEAVEDEVDAT